MEANINSPWFEWIDNGSKTVEIRINRHKWKVQAQPKTLIRATNPETQQVRWLKITARQEYPNFEECLKVELNRTAPGLTYEQALAAYRGFYNSEGTPDREYGVVVLSIQVLRP